MSKPKVFVSYASEDRQIADQIVSELNKENINCWISYESIHTGDVWSESIVSGIIDCPVFLLVLSQHVNNDPKQILRELEYADQHNKQLMCFQLEPLSINPALAYYYTTVHRHEAFQYTKEKAIKKLIDDIKKVIDQPDRIALTQERNSIIKKAKLAFNASDFQIARQLFSQIPDVPSAQYYLGVMALNGLGQPIDYQEAVYWLLKATAQEDIQAQYQLAKMYFEDKIEPNNPKLTFEYSKKAAEAGIVDAQIMLGKLYLTGYGILPSTKEGFFWLKKAASEGNAAAYYELGMFKCEDLLAGTFIRDFIGPSLLKTDADLIISFPFKYFYKAALLGHEKSKAIVNAFRRQVIYFIIITTTYIWLTFIDPVKNEYIKKGVDYIFPVII